MIRTVANVGLPTETGWYEVRFAPSGKSYRVFIESGVNLYFEVRPMLAHRIEDVLNNDDVWVKYGTTYYMGEEVPKDKIL